jgi:hypothetical protein
VCNKRRQAKGSLRDDWRQKVKSRRVKIVEDELKRRMQAHLHLNDSLDT